MNDDELERRLHDELHRRVVAPDAPERLYGSVGRLGLDELTPVRGLRPSFGRSGPGLGAPDRGASRGYALRRGARLFGGLATAACVVALLAVGLSWRSSHGTSALGGGPSSSAEDSEVATALPTPTPVPTASPSHFPAWSGGAGYVQFFGRLDAEFGYAVAAHEPYPSFTSGANPMTLYVTYDDGASWVDRAPAGDEYAQYMNLHFADPLNAWFIEDEQTGSAPVTGDSLSNHWIVRTSDGGVTWTRHAIPAPSIYMLGNLTMDDGQHGLVSLMSWDQSEPTYGALPGSASAGATPLLRSRPALAMTGPARTVLNQLWGTSDGGATWTKLMDVRADSTFPEFPTMTSANEAWALVSTDTGAADFQHSTDGGRTWESAALPLPQGLDACWWVQPAPTGSGNELSLGGMAGTTSDGIHEPSWDWVTWVSHDGGGTWAMSSATPLGHGYSAGPVSTAGRFMGLASSSSPTSTTYFDVETPGSLAFLDASKACKRSGGNLNWANMVSADDAWVLCTYQDKSVSLEVHAYAYSTTDGGLTWTPMMGAP
jgi:hypothetical protein